MRTLSLLATGLLLVISDFGWRMAAQDAKPVAIRAGKIHTVSGGVIAPGVIVIKDGRIADVIGGTQVPDGARVIDAAVVIPGLIDAFTSEAGAGDAEETIAADVRAIDGYDLFEDRRSTLAGGITTTYVTPGSSRLLSGQGAIVKAAGKRESRVLRASHGLRVTLGEAPKNPPGLFKAPVPPSSENPIRPVQRQYPSSRMGQFAELRKFFAQAKAGKPLPPEAVAVARDALDGRRPVFIHARAGDDIIKAVLFADEFKLSIVIAGASEADAAVDLLAERKIPVILDASVIPGERYEGDDARPTGEARPSTSVAAALAKAGVRVALQTSDDRDMRELLVAAAYAVRCGLTEAEALRAVTLTPAEILGVAERVGSIEKGKDADLVLLGGDPLSGASVVQRVFVDGLVAYERRESDVETYRAVRSESKAKEVLAIKGARILSVTHGTIADGMVLVEDGKIAYVGRSRPVPAGAKVIDATGLTAAPGLIDIQSHVGLHQDVNETAARFRAGRQGIPPVSPGPLSALVRLDDPEFAEVAAAGVTTVLLAPEQSGTCTLIKLAGGAKGASVLREIAALKLPIAGGTLAYKQSKEQIERGKKYHEEWEAWEKAQKEQKEPPKPAAGTPAEKPDPVTGTWEGTIVIEFGGQKMSQNFTVDLKLSGAEVTGTLTVTAMGRSQSQEVKGTFQNGELKFTLKQMGAEATVTLKIQDDKAEGTFDANFQGQKITGPVSARRTSTTPGAAASDGKKGPRKDDQLEPYRAVFRREAPVLAVARDLPSIENAVRLLRDDFNVDFCIVGGEEADFASQAVARGNAGAVFGPDVLRERRGATTNLAEALASTGVPIAFASGAQSGTRHLPLQLVYAVRHGLDGYDALKAVTVNPARILKMDARLGALERGRDADIVLYTGEPYLMTSRVRMVIVDGKVVHEQK